MEINIIILNLCGTTYYKIQSNDNNKKNNCTIIEVMAIKR